MSEIAAIFCQKATIQMTMVRVPQQTTPEGRAIRKFFRSAIAYKTLAGLGLDTFQAGGNCIAAHAIYGALGGTMCSIVEGRDWQIRHIVVRIWGSYWDSDGEHTREEMLAKVVADGLLDPSIVSFDVDDLGDILCPQDEIDRIANLIKIAVLGG